MPADVRLDIDRWFSKNTGAIAGLFLLYISALIAGVFCVSKLSIEQTAQLTQFYENVRLTISGTNIDFASVYFTALKINLKYLFLMFVSGFIVVGVPFVATVFALKVFYLGFALGTIYSLCQDGGFWLSFCGVFLQNVFSLPLLMLYAVMCAKFSFGLYKNARGISGVKDDFARTCASYVARFVLFSLLIAAFSLAECFIVMVFS